MKIPKSSFAAALVTMALIIIERQSEHNKLASRNEYDDEYDFIIIGAGSAGCVVANRITHDGRFKVLLLEAGGAETIETDIPFLYGSALKTTMDWNYTLVTPKCGGFAFNYSLINYPRGRVLGGSSTINSMEYVRGVPCDYDYWELNYGAYGWSWNDVLPYFIKSEGQTDEEFSFDTKYHGTDGEMTVTTMEETLSETIFMESANYLGYKTIDLNGVPQTGVAMQQRNTRNGLRVSSARAFLEPAQNRSNLHILTHSFVTKILFDANKRAIGVVFQRNNTEHTVRALNEIILSAGAINSPQLLMLSGIGHRKHLEDMGIEVIADVPVGDNLRDHVMTFADFTANISLDLQMHTKDLLTFEYLSQLFINGTGPLTYLSSATLRVNTKYSNDSCPDIQIYDKYLDQRYNFKTSTEAEMKIGLKPYVWDQVFKPYINYTTMGFVVLLTRPKSHGTLRLRSKNPYDSPLIDLKILSNYDDLKVLVEGVKMDYKLLLTEPYQQLNAKPFQTPFPNCEHLFHDRQNDTEYNNLNFLIPNDDYLYCMVRNYIYPYFHPIGTCSMGDRNPLSVVDNRLKVRKVHNLRVIDASVMPSLITGNTNAPAVMIGEKGSDLIKNDYN